MRLKVDTSPSTSVAVCRCGWRGLAVSHDQALVRAVQHEQTVHPDDRHARAALVGYRKRHAVVQEQS
jgi:hypothetical protein